MKKSLFLPILLLAIILTGCGGKSGSSADSSATGENGSPESTEQTDQNQTMIEFGNELILRFPDCETNKKSLAALDEVAIKKANSLVGQPATFFKDVVFYWDGYERHDGEKIPVFGCIVSCHTMVKDGSEDREEWVLAKAKVYGKLPPEVISKLSYHDRYYITSGTITSVDTRMPVDPAVTAHAEGKYFPRDYMYFGTYEITDLQLTEAPLD